MFCVRHELESVTRPLPDAPASAQHDQWMEEKLANGWHFGEVKDADAKTHPQLIPYDDLSEFEKRKDALVAAIISALVDPNI